MTNKILLLAGAAALALAANPANANDRYRERPPVVVSPDLAAPWLLQLGGKPGPVVRGQQPAARPVARAPRPAPGYARPSAANPDVNVRSVSASRGAREVRYRMDPSLLPQEVAYPTQEAPGTIVIDTTQNFLYLVEGNGKARRYGVGTGKPGFEWAGVHKITNKREWPDWRPPAAMIKREAARGHYLPAHMEGGPDNPLGARALYIGSTEYRIHGTNQPWTIGGAVSSGCIRMRNQDVVDLYERVPVGAKVVVI